MSDVCNVCMWVLEQAVVFEHAPHPALSTLIKLFPDSSIPHAIREGICYGVGGILLVQNNNILCGFWLQQDMLAGQNQAIKFNFQQAGGVNALVSLLSSFPYASLYAIGESVTACEENKRYAIIIFMLLLLIHIQTLWRIPRVSRIVYITQVD